MLWLCLHLPRLPLEVYTRGSCASDEPLAVVDGRGRRQRVILASEAAAAAGIRPGMVPAAAAVLATGLRILPRDPAAEAAALERLAGYCGQYSSLVSLDPPAAVLLEVGGSLKLFGGLARLCESLRSSLTRLGYHCILAVAPTPLAAGWLAHAGRERRVHSSSHLLRALTDLSLTLPGLEDCAGALSAMGVTDLGGCLRLPRDGLARRFGPRLPVLLDRALGRAPDPRRPWVAAPRFHGRLPLPAPVTDSQSLLFALNRLLQELCGQLAATATALRGLIIGLDYESDAPERLLVESAAPGRDPQLWGRLLRERLAAIRLAAPVTAVRLRAGRIEPLAGRNLELLPSPHQVYEQRAELVARLRARLGSQAVHGLAQVAEHRPERAWRYCNPGEAGGPGPALSRPLWLLQRPLPLSSPDGRPRLDGILHLDPDGERIESGWWDGYDVRREYYVARHPAGARLWIYREAGPGQRWFLHGIFG